MDRWISILDIALLILHFISILLERKKANDFKKQLEQMYWFLMFEDGG